MLLLIGISSESLDFKCFYGYPFKAEKNRSFCKNIINCLKGDFNQCSLSPQIMAFGKLALTDYYPKEAETKKILEFFSVYPLCTLFIPNNFEPQLWSMID